MERVNSVQVGIWKMLNSMVFDHKVQNVQFNDKIPITVCTIRSTAISLRAPA